MVELVDESSAQRLIQATDSEFARTWNAILLRTPAAELSLREEFDYVVVGEELG